MTAWGSRVEVERRRRIRLAVWAYAYEVVDETLVPDATFDAEALLVDLSQATGRPKLDRWFREHFDSSTGQWVHKHPDLPALAVIAQRLLALPPKA